MTPDEMIALMDTHTLQEETAVMHALIAHQQRRLRKLEHQRYREEEERSLGCDHVWEEWKSGHKGTTLHQRCVKCGKQTEIDSSD